MKDTCWLPVLFLQKNFLPPATPEEKPRLRTGWGRWRGLWVSPRMGCRLQLDTWLSLACILFHEWIEHSCTKLYYHGTENLLKAVT